MLAAMWSDRLRGHLIDGYLSGSLREVRRRAAGALHRRPRTVELYWQLDDPYAYLLAQAVEPWRTVSGLQVALVVVPAPAREVDPEPALRLSYARRDARDLSRRFDLVCPSDGEPTARQIELANRIALNQSPDASHAVVRATAEALLAADTTALESLAGEHGTIDARDARRRLRANTRRLRSRGHYLGCTLRYQGEWYWGVDRLAHLRQRLHAEGLSGLPDAPRERPAPAPPPPIAFGDDEPGLELFYSFRSPYAYLAVERTRRLARRFELPLRVRPVMPMVMRGLQVPFAKRLYIVKDAKREADRLGIPFGRVCDPLGKGIPRCMSAFMVAEQHGRGVELVASAARGIWSEALNVARDDDLRTIVERADVSWAEVRERLGGDDYQRMCDENRGALQQLGLWGVPVIRAGDYAVWGQDRLEHLAERLLIWRQEHP